MKRPGIQSPMILPVAIFCAWVAMSGFTVAQNSRSDAARQAQAKQEALKKRLQGIADRDTSIPSDPQLQAIHREFISKTEKLAMEYERKKQFDKARFAYQSIVRLVPDYVGGNQGLARVLTNQTAQDRKVFSVNANGGWQDTGVRLVAGMPVKIDVQGTWTVVIESGPEGIEIPKDQRPKDGRIRFGTLIGIVADDPKDLQEDKPMIITGGKEFVAEKDGELFLRMFDPEPRDNQGKLMVLIQSTFGR